jgi:hypothetical protein
VWVGFSSRIYAVKLEKRGANVVDRSGFVESVLFSVVQQIGAGRHSYVTVDPAPFRKLFPFCQAARPG